MDRTGIRCFRLKVAHIGIINLPGRFHLDTIRKKAGIFSARIPVGIYLQVQQIIGSHTLENRTAAVLLQGKRPQTLHAAGGIGIVVKTVERIEIAAVCVSDQLHLLLKHRTASLGRTVYADRKPAAFLIIILNGNRLHCTV